MSDLDQQYRWIILRKMWQLRDLLAHDEHDEEGLSLDDLYDMVRGVTHDLLTQLELGQDPTSVEYAAEKAVQISKEVLESARRSKNDRSQAEEQAGETRN